MIYEANLQASYGFYLFNKNLYNKLNALKEM